MGGSGVSPSHARQLQTFTNNLLAGRFNDTAADGTAVAAILGVVHESSVAVKVTFGDFKIVLLLRIESVINDAVDLDAFALDKQTPQHILPVRRFDFSCVADVHDATQFGPATLNDGRKQRREILAQRLLIFFGSSGQIHGACSLAVGVDTQRRHGRHFKVSKGRDPEADSVTTDGQSGLFPVFYCLVGPLGELLNLAMFAMRLHDVCQMRRQIPKFFRADVRARAFGNDFDASPL